MFFHDFYFEEIRVFHAFIATLLFDSSMSALPIIETQKSQSVGLTGIVGGIRI